VLWASQCLRRTMLTAAESGSLLRLRPHAVVMVSG